MTEDEAKRKFCPLMMLAQPKLDHTCIGSACMMWKRSEPMPMVEMCNGERVREYTAPCGYCGLAGKV